MIALAHDTVVGYAGLGLLLAGIPLTAICDRITRRFRQ